jgi:hypothetical protein
MLIVQLVHCTRVLECPQGPSKEADVYSYDNNHGENVAWTVCSEQQLSQASIILSGFMPLSLSLSLSLSPTPKVLSTYFHSLHTILLYCGSQHHPSRTSPEIAMSIDIPTGTDAMSDTYSPSYLVPN